MPQPGFVRVEFECPAELRPQIDLALQEILAGHSGRLRSLERDVVAIETRAMRALDRIVTAIETHDSGQTRRLVRFLAGLYDGRTFPFELDELRGLDDELAAACLDYLNYDRLGRREVHAHLSGGDRQLHAWIKRCGFWPDDWP
jgi:hypothetical protein